MSHEVMNSSISDANAVLYAGWRAGINISLVLYIHYVL